MQPLPDAAVLLDGDAYATVAGLDDVGSAGDDVGSRDPAAQGAARISIDGATVAPSSLPRRLALA